jgi:hypothetical protein
MAEREIILIRAADPHHPPRTFLVAAQCPLLAAASSERRNRKKPRTRAGLVGLLIEAPPGGRRAESVARESFGRFTCIGRISIKMTPPKRG